MAKYQGLSGRHARRRCPHSNLTGIYGDAINFFGGWRLYCEDCERHIDGPVSLAASRKQEQDDD